MNRIRPRTTVLSGAAFGLIAGAAVYGAVTSASATAPASFNAVKASASTTPATAAQCAAGQELEHGVCIVHVEHTVVAGAQPMSGSPSGDHHSNESDHESEDHGGDSDD